jgi:hypothetical protein
MAAISKLARPLGMITAVVRRTGSPGREGAKPLPAILTVDPGGAESGKTESTTGGALLRITALTAFDLKDPVTRLRLTRPAPSISWGMIAVTSSTPSEVAEGPNDSTGRSNLRRLESNASMAI